nr:hypothetical protein [Tanacetum cinerariifolium]
VPLDGPDVTINDPVAKLYEAERIRKDAEVTRQQVLQQDEDEEAGTST